jgi:hypothetical protein
MPRYMLRTRLWLFSSGQRAFPVRVTYSPDLGSFARVELTQRNSDRSCMSASSRCGRLARPQPSRSMSIRL